jgi:3-deoxy-D-manno-octulosonate 8-phosphate phosphatase (KDO 8-P phosphatase)
MKRRTPTALKKIELLVLDVDGVLTDGRLYFGARGETLKVFHVRDGRGLLLLKRAGLQLAVLSGRRSAAAATRFRELGLTTVVQGCDDKVQALTRICARLKISPLRCACIVDDTTDLPLMAAVGYAVAVADAHPLVRAAAHLTTKTAGGLGAVRELCDALLRARATLRA